MNQEDKDAEVLRQPYKKIAAAEELCNANSLLDTYVVLYKKRYKGQPIFPASNVHLNMIKSFAKSAGHKSYSLLETFFEMSDPWFVQHGHSIDCLMNNISKVNAVFSQRSATQRLSGKINLETFCDACHAHIKIQVPANYNYDSMIRCEPCVEKNAPPKNTTKAERHRAVFMMGKAFPDMPEGATEEKKAQQLKNLMDFEKQSN